MTDGAKHITLDRTNLLRLADVMEDAARSCGLDNSPQRDGFEMALKMLRAMAVEMPHLYGNDGCPVQPLNSDGSA